MKTESIIDFTNEIEKKTFTDFISTISGIYSAEDDKILKQALQKQLLQQCQKEVFLLCLCYQTKFFAYLDIDLKKPKEERELFPEFHKRIMKDFKEDYLDSININRKIILKKIAEINSEVEKEKQYNEPQRLEE